MHIDEALIKRRSARAFRPDPVPRELLEEILRIASRAPSGTNVQPWKIHVVAGEVRERLEREVLAHRDSHPPDSGAEFPRTSKRKEPYTSRMRKLGKDMYTLLGIPKGDQGANWRQWGRNYQFFDAPVGLILTIDKDLDAMSFVDVGMFAMAIMSDPEYPGRSIRYFRYLTGLCRREPPREHPHCRTRTRRSFRDLPRILIACLDWPRISRLGCERGPMAASPASR